MPAKEKPGFADLLQRHRLARGLSVHNLAQHARLFGTISPSYLVRLEKGERKASREKILILAKGLALSSKETDQLLMSAGHVPMAQREGRLPALENPAVQAILNLLGDPKIPLKGKLKAEETLLSFIEWLHGELTSSGPGGRVVEAARTSSRRGPPRRR